MRFSIEIGEALADGGFRRLFWANGLKATPEAVYLANRTLFDVVAKKPILGLTFFAVYEPVSTQWIQAAVDAGGDAFDLKPENGPLLSLYQHNGLLESR